MVVSPGRAPPPRHLGPPAGSPGGGLPLPLSLLGGPGGRPFPFLSSRVVPTPNPGRPRLVSAGPACLCKISGVVRAAVCVAPLCWRVPCLAAAAGRVLCVPCLASVLLGLPCVCCSSSLRGVSAAGTPLCLPLPVPCTCRAQALVRPACAFVALGSVQVAVGVPARRLIPRGIRRIALPVGRLRPLAAARSGPRRGALPVGRLRSLAAVRSGAPPLLLLAPPAADRPGVRPHWVVARTSRSCRVCHLILCWRGSYGPSAVGCRPAFDLLPSPYPGSVPRWPMSRRRARPTCLPWPPPPASLTGLPSSICRRRSPWSPLCPSLASASARSGR